MASEAKPTNFQAMFRAMTTPQLINEAWEQTTDPKLRDRIVATLVERDRDVGTEGGGDAAWPSGPIAAREEMAGLYPDPQDPQFAARLFSKREFYEARAVAAGVAEGTIDPCSSDAAERVFELTPVQRIVSRFLHPLTPYMGMLLFHGVGVGKTCSAVTIAEQFLEANPNNKVIVLVPQALKANFQKTIFDPSGLVWDAARGRWRAPRQCTGTSYLERLGLLNEPDARIVAYRAEEDRRSRYRITGYLAFANWLENILRNSPAKGIQDPVAKRTAEDNILRQLFSDHLIIIDEAHNLRDTTDTGDVDAKEAPAAGEAAENAGGKALNPFLKRIVLNAEGLRLVLMTATPMYNSAPEIALLLNYLLMNDTKSEKSVLKPAELFTADGDLKPGPHQRFLERMARRYVSYMRGENPYTFPLRMRPADTIPDAAAQWPAVSATKREVALTEQDAAALNALPLIATVPAPGTPPERLLREGTSRATQAAGTVGEVAADAMLDARLQMANISYPDLAYGGAGWNSFFTPSRAPGPEHMIRVYTPRPEMVVDDVFAGAGLQACAPKIHRVVESVRKARGICFAYSRYIAGGALPLAAALERAGFQRVMSDGRVYPLLTGVPAVERQCALCPQKQSGPHEGHEFRPARYVLLTSEDELSPKFPELVRRAATWPEDPEWGPLGGQVKVVIGSQVASEGLDLKCVREMHVLDPWYHLNRIEQIIGRAIRYCSHSALRAVETREGLPPLALNNCLVYLHILHISDFETADLYAYRVAIGKAAAVGRVQRLLKRHAWDCNLELEAITFSGLPTRRQIDAQGRDMAEYSIDDVDYTTYCDYQRCRHECAVAVPRTVAEGLHLDESTFGVADARRLVLAKQALVRRLFASQVMIPESVVRDIYSDLPWEIASEALMELLDGARFRITRADGVEGFLVARAGFLVFQPMATGMADIPMALRYSRAFQLRRHMMDPALPVFGRAEEIPAADATVPIPAAAAAAGAAATEAGGGAAVAIAQPTLLPPAIRETLLRRWAEWVAFVERRGPFPGTYLSETLHIWEWILTRYAGVPETQAVAYQWWIDKIPTFEELRYLHELALGYEAPTGAAAAGGAGADPALAMLVSVLSTSSVRTKQILAYRVYNPDTLETEYYCRSSAGGAFGRCASNVATIVEKALDKKPLAASDLGTMVGFLAAKKGRLVFKTLDTTKPKKHSSVGAECGNTSTMGEHRPRVKILHDVGLTSELAPLMLPDDPASWDEDGAKKRAGRPAHTLDLTHQPLCMYMEFLTRILDARRVGGQRWFLSATAATSVGLKGKR
jgi:hypothetical protein